MFVKQHTYKYIYIYVEWSIISIASPNGIGSMIGVTTGGLGQSACHPEHDSGCVSNQLQ